MVLVPPAPLRQADETAAWGASQVEGCAGAHGLAEVPCMPLNRLVLVPAVGSVAQREVRNVRLYPTVGSISQLGASDSE